MNITAIDCGASFIKGALFCDDVLVRKIARNSPPVNLESDIFDTSHIDSLLKIVREMLHELSRDLKESLLCISNEVHGFILADEKGLPFTDYISWQRELGTVDDMLTFIRKNTDGGYVKRTGMPLRSGLPSCNLFQIRKFLPQDKKLYFYTLGDYLIRYLSGQAPFTHETNAAATGLYDITLSQWDRDYIDAICHDSIIFTEIGNSRITFTENGTEFHALPAIGDQQAALLGSNFTEKSTLSFNIGTGAQVSRIIDSPVFGNYQIRPYFNGKYIKTVPHIPSGRALNVYFRFVKDIAQKFHVNASDKEIWQVLQESSMNEAHSSINCDLSFFENAITSHTKGSITEIAENSFMLDELMNAVINQMAENFVSAAERVNQNQPEIDSIIFSGGIASKWPNLVHLITERLNLNVAVTVSKNDTLAGCLKYAQMN